jgi:hypothetical protein
VALRLAFLAALVFCQSAALPTISKAASAEEGNLAFDAGQYKEAESIWLALAKKGDPTAEFSLGLLYDLGKGVPENASTAFEWYLLAGQTGLAVAQFNVGVMYDSGRGTTRSMTKAALWYARAAAQGHSRAAFNLGQLYELGDGVPKNPRMAAIWYTKVSAQIPIAAARLKTLAATRSPLENSAVLAPVPNWPSDGVRIPNSASDPSVQFVWTAPPEVKPVQFYIEVRASKGGVYRETYSGYETTSAATIALRDGESFAWRVSSVASDGSTYALGKWIIFGPR